MQSLLDERCPLCHSRLVVRELIPHLMNSRAYRVLLHCDNCGKVEMPSYIPAAVAQPAEQRTRNAQVGGSRPPGGTNSPA